MNRLKQGDLQAFHHPLGGQEKCELLCKLEAPRLESSTVNWDLLVQFGLESSANDSQVYGYPQVDGYPQVSGG